MPRRLRFSRMARDEYALSARTAAGRVRGRPRRRGTRSRVITSAKAGASPACPAVRWKAGRTSPSSAFSPPESAARRRPRPLPASPPRLRPTPTHRRRRTRDEGADATIALTSRPLRTTADRSARATAPNPEDCEDTSDDQPHPCHGPAHDGHRLRHPARQSLVESTCPKAPHSPLSAAQHRCRLGMRA